MKKNKKISVGHKRTKNWVISFGFLNGLWLAIGINPHDIVMKSIQPIINPLLAQLPVLVRSLFVILPTIITIVTLALIYRFGGTRGAIAVFLGFIGGLQLIAFPVTGMLCVVTGYAIGVTTFRKR